MIDAEFKHMKFPVILEKDEDGYFVAECPLFDGCYTQGKSIDEALENIREVIEMCLEEKENQERARATRIENFGFHAVSL
jgi:predicted RNase H-like HicB family nuclease